MSRSRASAPVLAGLLAAAVGATATAVAAAPARAATPAAAVPSVAQAGQITISGFNQSEDTVLVTVEIAGTATCFDSTGTASVTASAMQWQPEFRFALGSTTVSCSVSPVAWSVTSTISGPGFYPWGINLQATLTDDDGQRSANTSWWYPHV